MLMQINDEWGTASMIPNAVVGIANIFNVDVGKNESGLISMILNALADKQSFWMVAGNKGFQWKAS